MQARSARTNRIQSAEPDIVEWANGCALNPARIDPSRADDPALDAARTRMTEAAGRGLDRLTDLAAAPT